jgi:hypothetical protein
VDGDATRARTGSSLLDRLDQKKYELNKRYGELISTNRSRLDRVQQLEEKLKILTQEEQLVKAVDHESSSAKASYPM